MYYSLFIFQSYYLFVRNIIDEQQKLTRLFSYSPLVNIAPVADFDDLNQKDLIVDGIDYPIISNPEPIEAFMTFHCLDIANERQFVYSLEKTYLLRFGLF